MRFMDQRFAAVGMALGAVLSLLVRALETWDRKREKQGLPAQPGGAASLQQPRTEGTRKAVGVPADRG